jgi:hypothetical protein
MVYSDEPFPEGVPVFTTRRVTVAAYSEEPDELRFISDAVVTSSAGNEIASIKYPNWVCTLSIWDAAHANLDQELDDTLYHLLRDAWAAAESIPYSTICISPEPASDEDVRRGLELAKERGWTTKGA